VQANYEHIRNFFSDVGGVQSVRILKDKYTGKSRVILFVLMYSHSICITLVLCREIVGKGMNRFATSVGKLLATKCVHSDRALLFLFTCVMLCFEAKFF